MTPGYKFSVSFLYEIRENLGYKTHLQRLQFHMKMITHGCPEEIEAELYDS